MMGLYQLRIYYWKLVENNIMTIYHVSKLYQSQIKKKVVSKYVGKCKVLDSFFVVTLEGIKPI